MSIKSWLIGRYIVNTIIPAIVKWGFQFAWLRGHRTWIGALIGAIGFLAQTPLPPDILTALHLTPGVGETMIALGGYLITIGLRFRTDPLPPDAPVPLPPTPPPAP